MRPVLLFDLDGTLLDSDADIAAAANVARGAVGLAPLPEGEIGRHVGHGLGYLLAHVVPADRVEAARAAFIGHYRANLLTCSRPYPGAGALLRALGPGAAGLVTNKPGMFVEPILDGLGWRPYFGAVVAGDTLAVRKPDPETLHHALRVLGAAPADALYVGDSEVDRDTAGAAGVRFVAVAWGRIAPHVPHRVERLDALLAPPWR